MEEWIRVTQQMIFFCQIQQNKETLLYSSVHRLFDFFLGKYGILGGSLCDFLLGIMSFWFDNCLTFSGGNMDSWVARCVTVVQARSDHLLFLVPPFLSFSSCC